MKWIINRDGYFIFILEKKPSAPAGVSSHPSHLEPADPFTKLRMSQKSTFSAGAPIWERTRLAIITSLHSRPLIS